MSNRVAVFVLACLLVHLHDQPLGAQELADQADSIPTVVVFRFDGRLLKQTVDRSIDMSVPVKTWLLDAWCVGSGEVNGKVELDFADGTMSRVPIKFSGTVDVEAVSYTGPLVCTANTKIEFKGGLAIGFDGKSYFPLPASVCAGSETTLNRICTRRNRIGSRLLTKVAWRFAPGQLPRYDAAGSRMAEREIIEATDKLSKEVVAELNRMLNIEKTLVALAATQGVERQLSKTDRYLQIQVAPVESPVLLPPQEEMSADSLIEIWVYPNANRLPAAKIATIWQQVLRILGSVTEVPEEVQELQRRVSVTEVEGWDLIRLGYFLNEK